MITEDYCSFEISKLLKEKGFDEKCVAYYPQCITPIKLTFGGRVNYNSSNKFKMLPPISAPTHQMAMKWLRKVHLQHIQISYLHGAYHEYEYAVINTFNGKAYHEPVSFSSYEEAVEAALKYTLKYLI